MNYWMILVIIGLTFDGHQVCSLIVTDINVPGIVDFRDNVTLSCSYNMGGHKLNSVKWYKDENEFFRYSPMMHPYYMKFPVEGVELQDNKHLCNSSICQIELGTLGKNSSGVYRCEVSGDAPHFKLTTKEANMTVAALPTNKPLIAGFQNMYHFDEFVTANCSSDYSSSPVILSFYINGELALPAELLPRQEITFTAHDYLLRRQVLQINFYVNGPRFIHYRKILELKCVADIPSYPHLRLESKETAILTHDQNLNNQMLLSTGERSASSTSVLAISILVLRLALSIIFIQTQTFS
ncbi:uncharacterized protein LOC129943155 [Eupeodes corollae]|uniref:uncharacterized protein LOC129943155 n=1 Tax=Eupeodes corollae TaxID=290404 RepID=UPI00248FC77B|nr:uncharacterized protein LOC129943155 [Eupeodes corollae]